MGSIHEHAEQAIAGLGVRLKQMRDARGWTLDELAERSGLSKAFLSRLEAGDRQPSIAAILTLAKAYNVSIASLFEQPQTDDPCAIVRHGSQLPLRANGLKYTPLTTGNRPFNLQPIAVTVDAHRNNREHYQHEGEEWLTVVSGRLRLTIAERTYELGTGDCAHFDARQPHRLDALDGTDAQVILVACPIPVALQRKPRNFTQMFSEASVT
jgi:transcriptional regulator with XRE-family HTH domain